MTSDILQNVNLLKKYHNTLIYDYTEYPTKGNWSENVSGNDYKNALEDWSRTNTDAPILFYVHTPFCEQLCYFCLCSKEITKDYSKVKNYLDSYLAKELTFLKNILADIRYSPNVKEIYLGGGSPTYYKEQEFSDLLSNISSTIDMSNVETFTIEVDPRRVDVNRLKFYAACGVNRLSFGIQDFDPLVQKEINRVQPPSLLRNLLTDEIRSLFQVINFDLLIGLPGQTRAGMKRTIDEVVALQPTEIQTMYVHYKPQTRKYMTRMVRNGPMPDFYDRKVLFKVATEGLSSQGYDRAGYESFALAGDPLLKAMDDNKALYNSLGTTTGLASNFIAVGSSAHGIFGPYYFQNFYEQNLYRSALEAGEYPIYRGMKLTDEDCVRRDIIKNLRTYFRVDHATFETRYGLSFEKHFRDELNTLKEFEDDGLLTMSDGNIELTEVGVHFSPQICSVFDEYKDRPSFDASIHL